ncbi:Cacna1c, partial [Symbiodinium necroappetens]
VPQPQRVGDLAMSLLLTVPYRDLKAKHRNAAWMLYVDDRSWAAPNARQCVQIGCQWREWSDTLGLKENESKDQYHHCTVRGRRQLLAAGVPGDRVTPWPKILGVTLVPASRRKTLGTESDRLQAAAWVLKRVLCLPVPFARRVRFAGVCGVSKAAFGWMCRLPTVGELRSFDWKVALACKSARQADPSLRRIMLGHHASLGFRTAFDQVMALWRCVKNGDALPTRSSDWAKVVYKSMSRLGWSPSDVGWCWRNDAAEVSLDVNQSGFVQVADRFMHLLRESWRRVVYNEQQCTHARKTALTSRNAFTVLSGAAFSWARRLGLDGVTRLLLVTWQRQGLSACVAPPLLAPLLARQQGAHAPYLLPYLYFHEYVSGIGRQWREWSDTLGLKENESKDQYHHRTVRGRRQLLAAGVPGASGSLASVVSVRRPLVGCADPSLRRIMLGHHASLGFRTAFDQVMALWRCVRNGDALPTRSSDWAKVVYKSMSRLGWSPSDVGWCWRNDAAEVSLDVNQSGFVQVADRFMHLLRESWRRVVYNEQQCAHARKTALTSRNAFTVLTGAAYSWARRRRADDDRTCPSAWRQWANNDYG